MSAVLHVYEPDSSSASELSSYLDSRRRALASSFDEAPKLAHSIALELEEALDGEALVLADGFRSIGLTCIISEAEDMDPLEACLSALGGAPDGASCTHRDYDDDRLTGFCCGGSDDGGEPPASGVAGSAVTLIHGERIAGLQTPATRAMQAILDATAVLADELDEHFEFTTTNNNGDGTAGGGAPVIFGGRAPDGCIVGVLGMR